MVLTEWELLKLEAKRDRDLSQEKVNSQEGRWLQEIQDEIIARAPAGRGKVLEVIKRRTVEPKTRKKSKAFKWFYAGAKNSYVSIVQYPKQRYPVLYPNTLLLSPAIMNKLAAACMYNILLTRLNLNLKRGTTVPRRIMLPKELYSEILALAKRYKKRLKKRRNHNA